MVPRNAYRTDVLLEFNESHKRHIDYPDLNSTNCLIRFCSAWLGNCTLTFSFQELPNILRGRGGVTPLSESLTRKVNTISAIHAVG